MSILSNLDARRRNLLPTEPSVAHSRTRLTGWRHSGFVKRHGRSVSTLLGSLASIHLSQRAHDLARLCGQLGAEVGLTGVCGRAAQELSEELAGELHEIARVVSSAH